MNSLILFINIFKKEVIILKRYFFNTIIAQIFLFVIFLLIRFGYNSVSSTPIANDGGFEKVIIGFLIWAFATTCLTDTSEHIKNECKNGTLEQLYMSAYSFKKVLLFSTIAKFFIDLFLMSFLLMMIMFVTNVELSIKILPLLTVLIPTLLSFYSIGLITGGLTLVFKSVNSYTMMLQFIVILILTLPIESFILFKYLPGRFGFELINELMVKGGNLFTLGLKNVFELYMIGILYLVVGVCIYNIFERKSMNKGTLGHY